MPHMFVLLFSVLCFAPTGGAEEKELARAKIDAATFVVSGSGLPLNKLSSLTVIIEPSSQHKLSDFNLLSFNARMPEHNHGMLVKPRVTKLKPGRYLVTGVKLHMPGAWEFALKIEQGRQKKDVTIPYLLP